MSFKSINPFNGETIAEYDMHTPGEVEAMLEKAGTAFDAWRKESITERSRMIGAAGSVLRENVEEYARTITLEMGKPIGEARAEVEKCAWVCEYYAGNGQDFLASEAVETDASESFVRYDPIGAVLAVMPWNFPFWQVFRFAAPTITAGNVGLLKHASNVGGCARHIEDVFRKAGYPEGVFQNLFIDHETVERVIAHENIRAATLTGSERAGRSVAALAGKHLKKTVLELGGSNAFIVWEDADIDAAVELGIKARMLNTGQSCIASKRFILVGDTYAAFVPRFVDGLKKLRRGDPMDESTEVGPLAREDLAEELERQWKESVEQGAELVLGGERRSAFHEPTVLTGVTPGMPAFDEETFGPLATMTKAADEDEAFELASASKFGLGLTVCTTNAERARNRSERVEDGAYFINELVKSDPRLPFGGTKNSGYGRELGRDGMLEFVNKKTVFVKG